MHNSGKLFVKTFVISTLVTIVAIFSTQTMVWAVDEVPSKNTQIVCLNPIRCDMPNSGCDALDTPPLYRVHRVSLELQSQMNSNDIYLEECIERLDNGNATGDIACIPVPIEEMATPGTFQIRNRLKDSGVSATWASNRNFFRTARYEQCLASSTDPDDPDVIALCESSADELVDSSSVFAQFLRDKNYEFHGIYAQGNVSAPGAKVAYPFPANLNEKFEWGSSSDYMNHYFIATAYSEPIHGTTGSDPSDKVGRLGFPVGTPDCEFSDYDPFGQLFDRVTMQPVEGVRVALFRNVGTANPDYRLFNQAVATQVMGPQYILPTWYSPIVLTSKMGYYSFVVPPGTYKVIAFRNGTTTPGPVAGDFQIEANNSILDPMATELGLAGEVMVNNAVHTLYPKVYQISESGSGFLDIPSIVEGAVPERRDISVQGVTPAEPAVVAFKRDVNTRGDSVIRGKINKPFGMIFAKSEDMSTIIRTATADKDGKFVMTILASELVAGEDIRFTVEAVSLTPVTPTPVAQKLIEWVSRVFNFPVRIVDAQTQTPGLVMESRLSYLEGYSYDTSNKILPNARVFVMDRRSGRISFSTTSDDRGFFVVPSDALPTGEYDIYYNPENLTDQIKIDSKTFFEQNKEYFTSNNIDVRKPKFSESAKAYLTQNPEPSVSTTQGTGGPKQGTPGQLNQGVAPTRAMEQNNPVNQLSPALLMYVAILLLLIVGAGLLIVYYMKRRQEPHLYE